jgi:hypothetical protein
MLAIIWLLFRNSCDSAFQMRGEIEEEEKNVKKSYKEKKVQSQIRRWW